MPEGPSIVIARDLVNQENFTNKKIIAAEGNAKIDKEKLIGLKVKSFRSWGKHFLICFDKITVRVHFLMFGTYRINERKTTPLRLSLQFKKGELNFYTCAVKMYEQPVEELYDWSTDIMSEKWNAAKALRNVKDLPDACICDVLLNQDVFSGVGNIIKNEVLFRTKTHPLNTIKSIPESRLKAIIKDARVYSFLFLEWKKEFTLKKHWQAYGKKICPRCNIPFVKENTGATKRRSFYCTNCQKLYK